MTNDYRFEVETLKKKLGGTRLNLLEKQVIDKRLKWIRENNRIVNKIDASPRAAYELFLFDYLGLNPQEVPVISETDTEIIWESRNHCDTLEACISEKLDTKEICKKVYEKSTQSFLSAIDPSLRFHRDYKLIRPYSDHCKEMIYKLDFDKMMRLALEEAILSYDEGNKGYGAVVVFGKEVVGKSHDTAKTGNNPIQHAEVNAIQQAQKKIGSGDLSGAVLFSTCEPCPMCASLAVWSNITSIVYGASIEETAQMGLSRIMISNREIAEKAPVHLEIIDNVLKDECLKFYRALA